MSTRSCINCYAPSKPGDTWHPGEVCLFGMLFACSLACAEKWATANAGEGYKPGQPGFNVEIEPEPAHNPLDSRAGNG